MCIRYPHTRTQTGWLDTAGEREWPVASCTGLLEASATATKKRRWQKVMETIQPVAVRKSPRPPPLASQGLQTETEKRIFIHNKSQQKIHKITAAIELSIFIQIPRQFLYRQLLEEEEDAWRASVIAPPPPPPQDLTNTRLLHIFLSIRKKA